MNRGEIMFDERKDLEIPLEERLMIYPKPRQQLFLNLVENYKIFCPYIKMIYAALNFDSELKIDYLVIFEGEKNGKRFILWDAPYIYTNRCIPAYRYVVKNSLHAQFFESCKNHFSQMERDKFIEFLNSSLCGNLSTDSNNEKYWKDPLDKNKFIIANEGITIRMYHNKEYEIDPESDVLIDKSDIPNDFVQYQKKYKELMTKNEKK